LDKIKHIIITSEMCHLAGLAYPKGHNHTIMAMLVIKILLDSQFLILF